MRGHNSGWWGPSTELVGPEYGGTLPWHISGRMTPEVAWLDGSEKMGGKSRRPGPCQ
jgi:hypothetical protein